MLADFNKPESSISVDASSMCKPIVGDATTESAIDSFYYSRDAVIGWAFQLPFTSEAALRVNLLLIVFSAAETYFRRVISETLSLCPVAADSAAQQSVPLGAIASFGLGNLGLVISDTRGLTSSGELLQRTKNLLGLSVVKTSSVGAAIDQFERICNLRHCIVHSSGELLYNNRRDLHVKATGRLCISLDDKAFQDVVQVVVNAVRAYNNFVANEVLQRWFSSGHLVRNWRRDKKAFLRLHSLFTSNRDAVLSGSPFEVYERARRTMKKDS
jgi:hypothetical protein